ncbi:uncharacterized protein [Lolium perenne]|uniref:uncharacterized protein isoform X2 n=1 Tax=Lolium perenne TaxID=4522 RepID=UPI0021F5C7D6|nr:uncharacterized protein LOC127335333 isoform X2 [Lolium perenne]
MARRGEIGPPPPVASGSRLRRVLLDRVVHCTNDEAARDGTLSETSATCTGQPLAVSLRAAPPPAVSRLHLHWPEGLRPEMAELDPPHVIAAHGHSILFQAYVPHIDQSRPPYYPLDYFLYTASGGRRSQSLRRLPPCFDGGQVDQQTDQLFQPYRLQQQRLMPSEHIGLLCRGDEDFTVAELSCTGELCLLHHAPGMGEKPMRWAVQKLQMPNYNDAPDLFSDSWQTDVVIPYGDSSLCWVDCYLGLFFVTVHGDLTRKPHYVPMPAALDPRRLYIDPGCPDPARRVCVTDSGMINLICISDLAGRSVHGRDHHIFTITTWNLTGKEWQLDATIEASELWAALTSDKRLPLIRPEFPTMSLVDHDVVCFVLNDRDNVTWLVEVDLKKKVLGAVTLYIDEEEEKQAAEGEEQTKFCRFSSNSFIPSQFTMYLDKRDIKSLSFSKKLEQAKLKRGMEEAWIKDPKQVMV